jgi:hypothetical protein
MPAGQILLGLAPHRRRFGDAARARSALPDARPGEEISLHNGCCGR